MTSPEIASLSRAGATLHRETCAPVRTPDNTTTVRALQRAAKGTSNEARGIYVNRSMYSRTFER